MPKRRTDKGIREGSRRFIKLPLPVRLRITAKLLRTIDARREASGDQGIGSAVERTILDYELAELARLGHNAEQPGPGLEGQRQQVLKWSEHTTKEGPAGITKRQYVRTVLG